MTKRILLDARYLDGTYSGIGTYSRMLVEHLSRVDHENDYTVVVGPGFRENLELGENFELLSYHPKPVSLQSYFRVQDLFESLRPDIVHCLSPTAPVRYNGPMMITLHDLQPFTDPDFSARRPALVRSGYNLFYRWAYPAVFANARWIACDSFATRDDVVRLMPGALPKVIVVQPGLDPARREPAGERQVEAVRAKYGIEGRYLLYYGSTRPNKNVPNLVRAFARLVHDQERPIADDVNLVMVLKKDRFFTDIDRAIRRRRAAERVRVLEPIPLDEQHALLAGALAFCFPTKYEGFGFPPLEAMAAGVPVLAGDSGALPEVCADAALLVDPDDLAGIAEGLRGLVQNTGLRETLIARGLKRASSFDWDSTARTFRDIYELLF
ncbi:glycosyltransferase family 4 protein [Candidatus Poribacteria bacterium]|nr:glycosyltransferase family 4 protein [Candidatus Poribacteria bacterium]